MLTRRQLVKTSVAAAFAACGKAGAAPQKLVLPAFTSDDWLSQESFAGFESVTPQQVGTPTIVVVAGLSFIREQYLRALRAYVADGGWVIWERAANFSARNESKSKELLARFFDIQILPAPSMTSSYMQYRWPAVKSVRIFQDVARVCCLPHEIVAEYDGQPVALRRSLGKGGIIFLGAMLGPGIRAEEREAIDIGQSMFHALNSIPYAGAPASSDFR